MFTSRWRFAPILAAVIGVFSLGAIGHNLAFQGAPAPAAKKVPKEMLEKRRDAAKGVWEIMIQEWKVSNKRKISDLLVWSEQWLDAALPLCDKKEQRIAALKAHVDRTRSLQQMLIQQVKAARSSRADAEAATYARINAEIRYFEETGKTPPPTEGIRPDNELPKPEEIKDEK
jgi:hypothetical protein